MISLDVNDKYLIKHFFNTKGYVLDFSTSAFDDFCFQSVGVKICEKYGLSKGQSLEHFINEYPTNISMTLVKNLYKHYRFIFHKLPREMQKPELHKEIETLINTYASWENQKEKEKENENEKEPRNMKFDVFVSHASKDKLSAVDDIKDALKSVGANVWYDSEEILWGDSLEKKIDEGLSNCNFGIVVLSKTFFGQKWCERELFSLVERKKNENSNIILPLLLNVSVAEVLKKYPFLSDTKMYEYTKGAEKDIAIIFAKILIRQLRQENA